VIWFLGKPVRQRNQESDAIVRTGKSSIVLEVNVNSAEAIAGHETG